MKTFRYSWEEAIALLRLDPRHKNMIYNSYLTDDLNNNCERFFNSAEFQEVKRLLEQHAPGKRLLDIPAGNGIATYSFAKSGFDTVAVDPCASASVGRAAIIKVLNDKALKAEVVDAFGENLPFPDSSFDIVYVRQGLHHAADLPLMLKEFARVIRPGGILLACREHVVNNYKMSLQRFLESQVDHQLYGGENAFTLSDYRSSIISSGLSILREFGPFDSVINLFPDTLETLKSKILASLPGRFMRFFLSRRLVVLIGMWWLRRKRSHGRLYSFLAVKKSG